MHVKSHSLALYSDKDVHMITSLVLSILVLLNETHQFLTHQ